MGLRLGRWEGWRGGELRGCVEAQGEMNSLCFRGKEKTYRYQDTSLTPIARWATDGEIIREVGTCHAEIDIRVLFFVPVWLENM